MSYDKAWEAVYALTMGTGSIQKRLETAAHALIEFQPGQDFPEGQRAELEALRQTLTRGTWTGQEERSRISTSQLTDGEAGRLADKIVSLYTELRERSLRANGAPAEPASAQKARGAGSVYTFGV